MPNTIAITLRSVTDEANSVVDEFDESDPRTGINKLINYIAGVDAGARPGYMSIDINSATYAEDFAFNGGSAAGDTTIVTITTDELEASCVNDWTSADSHEFARKFINVLGRILAGALPAAVVLSDSVTQSYEMGENGTMSELTSFGFKKGDVLGDTSTTGSGTVEYKDCSALLPTTGPAVLGVTILGAGTDACAFVSWVEGTTPATTPTVSATSGDACMALQPVNVEKFYTVTKSNPVLAYATTTAAGQLRVRKASG